MAAASYYDNSELSKASEFPSSTIQQPAGMQSESQFGQEMLGQGGRGYPQQGSYGQQQMMGDNPSAQGSAQPMMNGNETAGGSRAAVADDRDGLTKCNDKLPDYLNDLLSPALCRLVEGTNLSLLRLAHC